MPDKTAVNAATATADKGVKTGSPTVEELLANSKAENERKTAEIQSLKSERDEIKGRLGELEEIEERRGELTAQQEAEKKRLERGQNTIDDEIEELKQKREAKPWFAHLEKRLAEATELATEKGRSMALAEIASDFLEEMGEKHGKDSKEMNKILKPFYGNHDTKSIVRRVQLAYKDWVEKEEFKAKKDELTKKEAELKASAEGNGRQSRDENASVDDLLKAGDKAAAREKLGIMQRNK